MLTAQREQNKYERIWGTPDYRACSPGLESVGRFIDIIRPKAEESLLDIGCGSGKAGLSFEKCGLDVWWLDITKAALDPDVPREKFFKFALWDYWPGHFEYGFCCDVIEHIPTEFTMLVLDRILTACKLTWFQIATVPDNCGQLIGETLHLTVRPYTWWLDRFHDLGATVHDSRDLMESGLYVVRRIR